MLRQGGDGINLSNLRSCNHKFHQEAYNLCRPKAPKKNKNFRSSSRSQRATDLLKSALCCDCWLSCVSWKSVEQPCYDPPEVPGFLDLGAQLPPQHFLWWEAFRWQPLAILVSTSRLWPKHRAGLPSQCWPCDVHTPGKNIVDAYCKISMIPEHSWACVVTISRIARFSVRKLPSLLSHTKLTFVALRSFSFSLEPKWFWHGSCSSCVHMSIML